MFCLFGSHLQRVVSISEETVIPHRWVSLFLLAASFLAIMPFAGKLCSTPGRVIYRVQLHPSEESSSCPPPPSLFFVFSQATELLSVGVGTRRGFSQEARLIARLRKFTPWFVPLFQFLICAFLTHVLSMSQAGSNIYFYVYV